MPEFFKKWIEGLTSSQADEMWAYLDDDCLDDAIELLDKVVGTNCAGEDNG